MNFDLVRQARIFIVDDEEMNVHVLERFLKNAGYENLVMTTDSRRAVSIFVDDEPDLVLLDLHMPPPDGYEILAAIRALVPDDVFLPIVVLTADITTDARRHALANGATDFLSKPFDTTEVMLRIQNVLQIRFLHRQLQNHNALLAERVRERTRLLDRTITQLIAELKQVRVPVDSTAQ